MYVSTFFKSEYRIHARTLGFAIGDLTVSTGFHGKPFFFALLHKYPLFIGSLERSDRAESGISLTFEKKYFLVKL